MDVLSTAILSVCITQPLRTLDHFHIHWKRGSALKYLRVLCCFFLLSYKNQENKQLVREKTKTKKNLEARRVEVVTTLGVRESTHMPQTKGRWQFEIVRYLALLSLKKRHKNTFPFYV